MKTKILFGSFKLVLVLLISFSCSTETGQTDGTGPVIPIDSGSINEYVTIQIGNQTWMAENLRITNAPDGGVLQGVYAYDNNESFVAEYGRLYTWQAAQDACPPGWHLPCNSEWNTLISSVGTDPGTKLKSGGSSGFNAKMGGRMAENSFDYIGEVGIYWTSTTDNPGHAFQKVFISSETGIISDQTPLDGGLSVRYIRD